jgi:cell division protein ZapA
VAQVTVTINGRSYPVACGEGEEDRIRSLAQYVDKKVVDFAKSAGAVGEARLLVLASLVLADELAEATESLRRLRRTPAQPANGHDAGAERALAAGIENLAARIEAIAERLETSQVSP